MTFFLLSLLGLGAGIVSGLGGIGGAVLVIPALVFFFHFPQHMAQGTSLAMLLPPIGILAAWRYWKAGHVDLTAAMILAAAFVIGAAIGAHFAIGFPQAMLKRLFGGLLIIIGGYYLSGR